jgi:hypothetical protein
MLLSILFLAVTGLKFFKMDPKGVTPEQKVVLFLSAVTVTFNDPFYIGTILAPSSFTYSHHYIQIFPQHIFHLEFFDNSRCDLGLFPPKNQR